MRSRLRWRLPTLRVEVYENAVNVIFDGRCRLLAWLPAVRGLAGPYNLPFGHHPVCLLGIWSRRIVSSKLVHRFA